MAEFVQIRQCDECGAGIEGRADARYCSNACRQRAYRRRAAILKRYGSWEGALAGALAELADLIRPVTDNSADSRNGGPS